MYALYKLSQIALRPELWLVALLAAAWWLARRPEGGRRARRLVGATALAAWLAGAPVVRDLLVGPLVAGVAAPAGAALGRHDAIVVLSGGRGQSLERTTRGVVLWRQGVAPLLVVSGGVGQPFGGEGPEAPAMAAQARALGVPDQALAVEDRARTTWENGVEVRRLLPAARRVVVVSSRLHLRRAAAVFRRQGFEVTAVAAEPEPPEGLDYEDFLPTASAVADLREAVHEYVGLAAYRFAGQLGGTAPARP
jgi:uncharacterized SAM-binding protein YcdF (DUF218 family)